MISSSALQTTEIFHVKFNLPLRSARHSPTLLPPNRYYIGILNPGKTLLHLQSKISLLNRDLSGSSSWDEDPPLVYDQLPIQQKHSATAYRFVTIVNLFCFTLIFSCFFTIWRRLRGGFRVLHGMFCFIFFFRGLVACIKIYHLHTIQKYGKASAIGEFIPLFLEKITSTLELLLFLLLAVGYKVVRANLNLTEIRFLLGLTGISLYLGVVECTCTTPGSCSGYKLCRDLLQALAFLVIIVAMNFNLQSLAHQIVDTSASVESARLYSKLKTYQTFRWIFLVFIGLPSFLVFMRLSLIDWRSFWLDILLKEVIGGTGVVLALAYAFQPRYGLLRIFELSIRRREEEESSGDEGN